MKKILILLTVLTTIFSITACGIESVDDYESKIAEEAELIQKMQSEPDAAGNIVITLTVRADRAMNHPALDSKAEIPNDGFWIKEKEIVLSEDSNVYDIMVAARHLDVLEFKDGSAGGHNTGYISDINGLIEKECGLESGWKFEVNNELASMGCKQIKVKDGDNVVWFYAITADEELN